MGWVFWLFVLLGTAFLAGLWLNACVEQTVFDREAVLELAEPYSPENAEALERFCQVSPDQHLRAYLTFRDPWKLYAPEFREWLGQKVGHAR